MASYDRNTALLVVDIQNDFADPAGGLYVRGGEEVVPVANREAAEARSAGALVVHTQDWHPETTPHFQKDGGVWPVHCVQETWGAAFHPDLRVEGDILYKGIGGEDGYSAFSVRDPQSGATQATQLEGLLKRYGITRVVVLGLATDYCVRETALDARRLGLTVEVVQEGIRAVDLQPGDGDRAIQAMEARGVTFV